MKKLLLLGRVSLLVVVTATTLRASQNGGGNIGVPEWLIGA